MKCKSCNAEIKFIKMPSGKFMPVDAGVVVETQAPDKLIKLNKNTKFAVIFDCGINALETEDLKLFDFYRPHWAGCLGAEQFRTKGN